MCEITHLAAINFSRWGFCVGGKVEQFEDGYMLFKTRRKEAARKIEWDKELSDEHKSLFWEHIRGFKGLDSKLNEYADNFFNQHKFKGTNLKLALTEKVGHVLSEDRLMDLINDVPVPALNNVVDYENCSDNTVNSADIIIDLIGREPDAWLQYLRLKPVNKNIGNYVIWVYMNDADPINPFNMETLERLVCRLGLYEDTVGAASNARQPYDRHFGLGISVPKNHLVCKPTAFDPGTEYLDKLWEPGGYTKPSSHCQGDKGLAEAIIKPLGFECVFDIKELT